MKKIRSSIVAILLILSVTLVAINLVTITAGPATESGARAPRLTDADFHWMDRLGVISEPVPGVDNNDNTSSAQAIAVEDDTVHVVWIDETDMLAIGNDYDIFYRFYDGSTWSPIQIISEPAMGGSDDNDMASLSPDIAVENGKVYIVWADYTDYLGSGGVTEADIFYRHFDGSSWKDIEVISEPYGGDKNDGESDHPAIDVENGKIYVVWHDNTDWFKSAGDWDIFYTCNLTGTSWEFPIVISEPRDATTYDDHNTGSSVWPSIDVDNGNIYVVWNDENNTHKSSGNIVSYDIFYRCNLTGTSFEKVQVISEPVYNDDLNIGDSENPRIAVENDNIYVVWHDDNDTLKSDPAQTDIFYICNLSTGSGWEDVQVISEPIYNQNWNKADSFFPDVDVENGVIYAVWNDLNESLSSGPDEDIFFLYNDTVVGSGWSDLFAVSEPVQGSDFNKGDGWKFPWPRLGVNLGKIHVVWDDENTTAGSGTDWDIHYRKTFVAPALSAGAVTPITGNTSTIFKYTVTYMDPDNEAPTEINVKINGVDQAMTATTPGDTFFLDGNEFFYDTTIGIGAGHTYEFWATDGVYTRTFGPADNPDVMNTAPNITTANVESVNEDVYYEVVYEYDDMDRLNVGQTGTWTCLTDAAWLVFNATFNTTAGTAMLNGTPTNDDTGDWWVNITIDDGIETDWTNFTITVNLINDAPVMLTDMLPNATEDDFYEIQFEAEDVDSPTLYWSILTNAGWLTVNITEATINGTPINTMVGGDYWVYVRVDDGYLSDDSNFTLDVDNVNDLPMITTTDVTTVYIDEPYKVDYDATDDDMMHGDILTWSLETNAGWLDFNTTSGVLSGTSNMTGSYWVNVSVDDGNGGKDFHNFTLDVEIRPILNLPPVINTTNLLTATVNVSYSVVYEATDDFTDAINLTWTMDTSAGWLDFNTTSAELFGTPKDADVGLWWVNITVTDDNAAPLSTYTNFTINVTKPTGPGPGDNHEPELSQGAMSPASGDEDTQFTFTVHYEDEDGDPPESISVVIDGVEYEMDLKPGDNETNGDYIYVTKLPEGNHTYYFKASDGEADAVPDDDTPTTPDTAATTPDILKGEKKDKKESDSDWMLWLAIIIIIIVVLAILAFAMMRRKPAAGGPPGEAPEEGEEDLEEWEEDEEGEEGEDEWEEDEEGEEDEDEWEEDEDEEAEEDEEFEDEEEGEEEAEDEDEWEEDEEETEEEEEAEEEVDEDLPPVKSIDCPKCKTDIEIPFSEDAKVGLECPSCGAKGKISNPYME